MLQETQYAGENGDSMHVEDQFRVLTQKRGTGCACARNDKKLGRPDGVRGSTVRELVLVSNYQV